MQLHATVDTRNLSPKNMCEVLPSARLLRVAEMITKNTNEVYASLFGGSRPSGKTCPKLYRFFTALDRKLCQKPSSLRVDCSGPVAQIGKACCLEAQAPRALELVAFSSQNHGLAESRPSRILHLGNSNELTRRCCLGLRDEVLRAQTVRQRNRRPNFYLWHVVCVVKFVAPSYAFAKFIFGPGAIFVAWFCGARTGRASGKQH